MHPWFSLCVQRQWFRHFSDGECIHSLPVEAEIHILNPCRRWLQFLEFTSLRSKHFITSFIPFWNSDLDPWLQISGLKYEASLSYRRASVAPESHCLVPKAPPPRVLNESRNSSRGRRGQLGSLPVNRKPKFNICSRQITGILWHMCKRNGCLSNGLMKKTSRCWSMSRIAFAYKHFRAMS